MRMLFLAMLVVGLTGLGCGAERYSGDDPDGDADADTDIVEELQCGDEREPLDLPPEPIVNGSETWDPAVVNLSDGEALAVGALLSNQGGAWSNACTATLVTPNAVLTAAHCVTNFWNGRVVPASSVRFAVGDDAARPVRTFDVASVERHPSYRAGMGGNARNDVALLILREDATAALPELRPIPANCTPLAADTFVGQRVQNVGYGITEPMSWPPPPNNTRRYWTVEEVVELTDYDFIVDGHGVSSVCNGDSGGPSLWTMPDGQIRVMGTVSWGDPSCVDRDHFTRVDDNCDFLDDFIDLSDPCEGETFAGRCDGQVAVWCEADAVVTRDCAAEGLSCGPDDQGRSRCLEPGDCDGLGWEGRCDGEVALWCQEGQVRARYCADCEQTCGWSDEHGGFYCL